MSKFKELINSELPVLVDFYATWCGPCKMMSPILEEVAVKMKGQVKIVKVDVDKNPNAAEAYQVRGVPTLILFKNGKQLWRQSGVVQANQLIQLINQHN
ncbi:MAG: thioredoxin [Flavobacteriales bacterium]|nr:thioredoxin [Flavobacteriales bacterium]HRN40948.1 thioredoxin [Vicingus sp.]HRP60148.1 thioredoxin [Vicingus sp.]